MRWLSGSSDSSGLQAAFTAAAASIVTRLEGVGPDLVLAFVSSEHHARYGLLAELVAEAFPGALLLGCSAESVIGGGREIEERPGLSLTAALLPATWVVDSPPPLVSPREFTDATLSDVMRTRSYCVSPPNTPFRAAVRPGTGVRRRRSRTSSRTSKRGAPRA